MIRKRDNPLPVSEGGCITIYYGPAKNRPMLRVYELWAYASIRHRATLSEFWFRLYCQCASVITLGDGFRGLAGPEAEATFAAVLARHEKRHPPRDTATGVYDDD